MELYPKTPFSELAISRSERFWLWLAGSNARWRGVSWIVAIFWTGILVASGSDSPQIVVILTFASWCSLILCHLSHSLLGVLGRQVGSADPRQKSTGEQGVAPQSATRSESDLEGIDKRQPESEARSR